MKIHHEQRGGNHDARVRGRTGSRNEGFTLIELSIAVVIIGILAAIALPAFGRARASAARGSCLTNQRNVLTAATLYVAEFGIANDTFNVNELVVTGRLASDVSECPESGTVDHDDYVITVEGGMITAIECSVMLEQHLFRP